MVVAMRRLVLGSFLQKGWITPRRACANKSDLGRSTKTVAAVVTAAGGLGAFVWTRQQARIAEQQTDSYKIDEAANKIAGKFVALANEGKQIVPRKEATEMVRRRLLAREDPCTTVVAGQFMSGKTTLVEGVLEEEIGKGILKFTLTSADWEMGIYKEILGDIGLKMNFKMALRAARAKMDGRAPFILLDIPRHSFADMGNVSTWCKEMTQDHFAKILVVASQMEVALRFDAGGEQRQFSLHVDNLEEGEALEVLKLASPQLEEDVARNIVKLVGTNPGVLEEIARDIAWGKTVEEALAKRREACGRELAALKLTLMKDARGKLHDIGCEILGELVKHGKFDAKVKHQEWHDKGLYAHHVAKCIKEDGAYAITYHFVERYWYFASPMHFEMAK